ncbi:MAG: YceI family protein [Actinomycetota bacterium]|nr:YceI family protein [Actinomycetota bacterium]
MPDTVTIPELTAGTWTIDPAHSEIGFSVRHLMVSKVKGTFKTFEGTVIVPAEDASATSVEVKVDMASVNTGEDNRDNHLRSGDFFSTEEFPHMTFNSTSVTKAGSDFKAEGTLSIHGVAKPVTLDVEFNGVSPDPWGGTRAGFSATTEISRKEFGIDIDMPLEGGGVVVGDRIKILLEVEAVLQQG